MEKEETMYRLLNRTPGQRRPAFAIGGTAVLLAVALSVPAIASAGKPTGQTLSVPDGQFATTNVAYVGSSGSKEVRLAAGSGPDSQYVRAECSQQGSLVYRQYSRVQNGQATLTLGPTPSWTAGSASCTAELGEFDKRTKWRSSNSATFSVSG